MLLTCALQPLASAAERWKLQFFHDEDQSELTFTDLQFPTAQTGIACGILVDRKNDFKPRGVALITRDAGETWKQSQLPDIPVSIHFVDESLGYMAGEKGIWKTEERGLTWKRLKSVRGINKIYFTNARTGFAVGMEKLMLATTDGGITWSEVPESKKPSGNVKFSGYQWIAFDGEQRGIVFGSVNPPRRRQNPVPDWADPEAAAKEREWPALTISLETKDGGKTWSPQTAPVFGQIVRLRFVPNGIYGLSLLRFERAFSTPSEVYLINWKTGKSESVFKDSNRLVTDLAFLSPTSAMIAAIEKPGTMPNSPLPGKLKILRATNLRSWIEMPVDYRASGTHAILAAVDEKHAWVAMNTGMILRLTGD
jgi:hypothetical protein